MGLNSVQWHVKGLLNGLEIPGQQQALTAYITPPPVEPLNGPRAYIWGTTMRGRRQTMPRGPGFTKRTWAVDVFLTYLSAANDPLVDQAFPLLMDAVLAALEAATMPTFITDPTTGEQTQLLSIAEVYDHEYPPERATATQRLLLFGSRLGFDIEEARQA